MKVIFVINIVMWTFITWHYVIRPRAMKQNIYRQLRHHPEFKTLKKTERFIKALYKNNEAYILARQACKQLAKKYNDFVYGEIEFIPFISMLMKVNPTNQDVFYDLGCGSGKAVLSAALCFNLKKACGVELLSELYGLAQTQMKKARQSVTDLKRLSSLELYYDNILNHDFIEASIVYVNATCFSGQLWGDLCDKMIRLNSGSRIIVSGKQIQHENFKVISSSNELMSWGLSSVTIYLKTG